MLKRLFPYALLLGSLTATAQEKGFLIQGTVPLPDGYSVGIVCRSDTSFSVEMANGYIHDGRFTLTGHMEQPQPGTLMTNNLELVEKNHWPQDSIRWTYSDIFLSPGQLTVTQTGFDAEGAPLLQLSGTPIQSDFSDLQRMGGANGDSIWQFIDCHPQSVVSIWLGTQLLERAYRLTADQLAHLEATVQNNPADPKRFAKFQQQVAAYKTTVKNAPLTDLELKDTLGTICHLTEVVPQGQYVLIDFWASWCGICLYSMPDVAKLVADFPDRLRVVGVSIDTDDGAWHRAMKKHPEPWPQYCTTPQGYKDLFSKYQVGNGVPYYLLLSPEGKVVLSPERPDDVRDYLLEN